LSEYLSYVSFLLCPLYSLLPSELPSDGGKVDPNPINSDILMELALAALIYSQITSLFQFATVLRISAGIKAQ
jgi:hypothetical protein